MTRTHFSAKQTVTARTGSLKPDIIEAKECLHHWMTNGVFDGNLELLQH